MIFHSVYTETESVTTHIIPDVEFLVSSLEEPSLSDYEFDEEDLRIESHNEATLPEIDIISDIILSSSSYQLCAKIQMKLSSMLITKVMLCLQGTLRITFILIDL